MDSTYSQNLLAKASVASVSTLATSIDTLATSIDTLATSIDTRLAGPLAPSKIDVVGDDWSQIKIQSNSEAWEIPSEIAFNRQNKSQFLKSAMGVAGDLTRGAFWWVGGEDRLNINCETGVVKLKNGLQVSSIKTDIIQSLTTGSSVRIDDRLVVGDSVSLESYLSVNGAFAAFGDSAFSRNVTIAGNLTTTGTITASNSNPFWCAGKYDGYNRTRLSSKGRYGYSVVRIGPGYFTISPDVEFDDTSYVVSVTCQADGQNANARIVNASLTTASFSIITYNNNVATDQSFHFLVIP
jgi:hypothetical protein